MGRETNAIRVRGGLRIRLGIPTSSHLGIKQACFVAGAYATILL